MKVLKPIDVREVVTNIDMNPNPSEFFDQNSVSDMLPVLEYVAPMHGSPEELNQHSHDLALEDCPPTLEDFHQRKSHLLNINAAEDTERTTRDFETPEDGLDLCNDYIWQTKSDHYTEKPKTFSSKESTGNSLKRNIDAFNDHCSLIKFEGAVDERDKTSNRYHMMDADNCNDNDSEKDDDKMDEDDDDLTKKLLSIQVLPRIPKLKRTETSGGNFSESSVPQRSVLERAEITTKSSSYPNWPKSNGGQTDEKLRWHNDNKGKNMNRGFRNRKEVDSRVNTSRNFMNNRSSGSNFRRSVDFEKPKSTFSKRVPCELLFDAVVGKGKDQIASSCEKNGRKLDSVDSDLDSGSSLTGTDNESVDSKLFSSDKNDKSCNSNDDKFSKFKCKDARPWSNFPVEDFKHNETKFKKHEIGTSSSGSSFKHGKISETKSREDPNTKQGNSSRSSDKHLLPNASQNPVSPAGTGNSVSQNGSHADIKQHGKPNELQNLCSTDTMQIFSHESIPLPTKFNSDDSHFKRPCGGRVPRSKVRENAFEQTGISGSRNKHPSNFDVTPMDWNNGNEQVKSRNIGNPKSDSLFSKKSTPSPNQSDSLMEVIDMDVVASPLCDDNLLSTESAAVATSSANAVARKVVTFDCPEKAEGSQKNVSKKQKVPKHDKGAQQASFETKCDIQKQVVSVMKELLRPLYSKRKISKDEYKEIMRQAVPKLCHNRKSQVSSSRIKKYADKYTSRVLKSRKQSSDEKQKTAPTAASSV